MCRQLTDVVIVLSAEDVLRGQGIAPDRASHRLVESANAAVEEALSLLSLAALYTVVELTGCDQHGVPFAGGRFGGPLVARAMTGAEQLGIAVCTIGEAREKRVEEMMCADVGERWRSMGRGLLLCGRFCKLSRSRSRRRPVDAA